MTSTVAKAKPLADLADFKRQITKLRAQIPLAKTVEDALRLVGMADTIEEALCAAGYRTNTEAIRPANETRFEARWRLGQLLAKVERGTGPGRGKKVSQAATSFRAYLRDIGLQKDRANECERIGAIPREKLTKVFSETEREGVLNTRESMFLFARPFWKIKVRIKRHRAIREAASTAAMPEQIGPFTVLYADPPTEFQTYTEGSYRGPNQQYPTMSWEEIENLVIGGKRIEALAHENAVLFLWSTSSNLDRALKVMSAWGFIFKASAVWDKAKIGTGLIFRNMHEVLLFGDRGKMPGPVHVPPSVFRYPRGAHSAKPAEIRIEIERMYPDYDASSRLELFSRGDAPGWTHWGFEAKANLTDAAE
jgi:N6-adenosine-specific RNA methylase IME4